MFMIVAVAATGLGTYNFSGAQTSEASSGTTSEGGSILGHVTLTATHDDGTVFAYVQTDNTVLDEGDACMMELIFGAADSGTYACTSPGNFDIIHIGTGGTLGLPAETLTVVPVTCGIGGADDDVDGTVAYTHAGSGAAGQVVVSAQFTDVNGLVDEAALSDNAACQSGNAIAYQTFTEINLGATDDLTVDWTITIDGSPA